MSTAEEQYVVDELAFRVAVILPLQEYEQRKDRPCCGGGAARRTGHRVQGAGGTRFATGAIGETPRRCRIMLLFPFSRARHEPSAHR